MNPIKRILGGSPEVQVMKINLFSKIIEETDALKESIKNGEQRVFVKKKLMRIWGELIPDFEAGIDPDILEEIKNQAPVYADLKKLYKQYMTS